MHIVSQAKYYTDIRFKWKNGNSSDIAGGIDNEIVNFDGISRCKAIYVPILLCVSGF